MKKRIGSASCESDSRSTVAVTITIAIAPPIVGGCAARVFAWAEDHLALKIVERGACTEQSGSNEGDGDGGEEPAA